VKSSIFKGIGAFQEKGISPPSPASELGMDEGYNSGIEAGCLKQRF
jgi:hypothetical protein